MTASKYAKERKAFGKQIGEFGLIREKLAEMADADFCRGIDDLPQRRKYGSAMITASGAGNETCRTP